MSRPRIVVITGATRGIGRGLVEGFAAAGHTVCGCGRSELDIASLSVSYPAPHRFDPVDVREAGAVDAWGASVIVSHGPPDLLINNAGVINRNAPLWDVPAYEFEAVIGVNVIGVANVIRAFLPAMIENRRGVVVNMSSGWGRSTSAEVAPYCASKYAVEGLTSALAEELPPGLAAVTLSPGTVDTDMLRSAWGATAGLSPSPEEWAERGVPALLAITAQDNGRVLTI